MNTTQPLPRTSGKPYGNPVSKKRGEVVRAVLGATLRPNQPMLVSEVARLVNVSRTGLLWHLATMQRNGRLKGYTTANGWVRVW